ncbi:DUF5671 domain-containing protein [Ketogulonicigenium vulgare]|uniref:DUF5671 domain-containing protein n=1 Tax=Ketogulonicigenium vulgare (strain WSH-001) TaxID=759362 RepID=F9Y8A0_KETVW|nr:DUF5671 domain-containing protein [Ketogulonicigenium vulgare]ADO41536.1 conserved hypothetical protein [Ketogulonicigenium vulgare Y25]AEM42386.1 hypothetical protein KVU_2547 [Ketogulonicigenium vulgare WSH-001]ALJ80008.1 hypothetical protein KVH_01690 [Ketogulonicigenium vulgare]ANW32895.1 hypothetical protein KvSKV_01695 [Ketogulonicigenium vulgare]AOZ53470.1 hypothetical protein KVC_0444 [Ketogulonicigenium vulgare]
MSAPAQLSDFVRDALAAGIGREVIRNRLQDAGWSAAEAENALAAWADPEGRIPPMPRPQPSYSAREALFYALKFLALIVVVWNVQALGSDLIERLAPRDYVPYVSRWSIANLIVFTPVFIGLHLYTLRLTRQDAAKRRSPVRIWLGNIGQFIAVLTLLGIATTVIGTWLSNALDMQLALNLALLSVISVLVALFFRAELATK